MTIKSTPANGVNGCLLNPYHKDGNWVFRVYHGEGKFTDYDLRHSDMFVTINDADAYFYETEDGTYILDHSPSTLGK